MRALIFGPMPRDARPDSHIAAGPWCFAGREDLFPDWDRPGPSAFVLPPDPFADASALDRAARAANATALRLCRDAGPRRATEKDAADNQQARADNAVRQLLFGPYFLLAAHVLIERQQRLLDLLTLYGHEALRVPLPRADGPFAFLDSRDFMLRGVLDPRFNQIIYARLLQAMAPPAWRLEIEAAPLSWPDPQDQAGRASGGSRLRRFIARRLRDLPFPRYKGFGLGQALLLSLAALTNKRQRPDASLDFSLYCGQEEPWHFDADLLIHDCMPLALRRARPPQCSAPNPAERPGPLRGMTPAFMEDEAYRLRLARQLARGRRLFAVQHGANYGNLRSIGILPFEYCRHAFFTWGWSRHQGLPVNARPLPHPLLLRVAGRHRELAPELILVGAEMSSLSYRLKSRPQAGSLPAYREAKTIFLRAMAEGLDRSGQQARLLYRPYPAAPAALDDEAYIIRSLPGIKICRGDLAPRLLGCRLLVLDHYGSTLHQALAADTPLIAFWDKEAWSMEEESECALDRLRAAGMLFDSPEAAAAQALALWPQVGAWWLAPERRAARAWWLDHYARLTDDRGWPLSMAALTRIWMRALQDC